MFSSMITLFTNLKSRLLPQRAVLMLVYGLLSFGLIWIQRRAGKRIAVSHLRVFVVRPYSDYCQSNFAQVN